MARNILKITATVGGKKKAPKRVTRSKAPSGSEYSKGSFGGGKLRGGKNGC